MAQAILDICTPLTKAFELDDGELLSTRWSGRLSDGELLSTSWSGETIDVIYVSSEMRTNMKRDLEALARGKACRDTNCTFSPTRGIWQRQCVEAHYIVSACKCGYFASYRATATKHGHHKHIQRKVAVTQLDSRGWTAWQNATHANK